MESERDSMAVQEAEDVEKSEQYHDLSPKRQDIVDAWAELYNEQGQEPKNVDVVDRADANESYTSQTLTEYKHIAEARAEQMANDRDQGEMKTKGDPFEGKLNQESMPMQTIQERPNKGTPSTEVGQNTQDDITYTFTAEEIETIVVDSELPEGVRDAIQREVIHRAFGD